MKLLAELLTLREGEVPIELEKWGRKIATSSASDKKSNLAFLNKLLQKHWGNTRLTWHGDRFFDDGDLGQAYAKAEAAAKQFVDDGYSTTYEDSFYVDVQNPDDDNDSSSGEVELNIEVEFDSEDMQETYLGYSPKFDRLYIGFDASPKHLEDDFNNDWDKAFEDATGVAYDHDNEEHAAEFQKAWESFNSDGSLYGLLFEVTNHNGEYHAEEAWPPMKGGFYKHTYRDFKAQHPDIIDLRLD
jgi:hypothetical protein